MVHKELYSILITAVYSVQLKGEVDVVPHVVVTVHMVFKALDIVRMYCRSAKSIAERSGSGRCAKMYTGCNFQDFQCLDAYSTSPMEKSSQMYILSLCCMQMKLTYPYIVA